MTHDGSTHTTQYPAKSSPLNNHSMQPSPAQPNTCTNIPFSISTAGFNNRCDGKSLFTQIAATFPASLRLLASQHPCRRSLPGWFGCHMRSSNFQAACNLQGGSSAASTAPAPLIHTGSQAIAGPKWFDQAPAINGDTVCHGKDQNQTTAALQRDAVWLQCRPAALNMQTLRPMGHATQHSR